MWQRWRKPAALQMLLDCDSHHPLSIVHLAGVDGKTTPRRPQVSLSFPPYGENYIGNHWYSTVVHTDLISRAKLHKSIMSELDPSQCKRCVFLRAQMHRIFCLFVFRFSSKPTFWPQNRPPGWLTTVLNRIQKLQPITAAQHKQVVIKKP